MTLSAQQLPPDQFGIFLVIRDTGTAALPTGGTHCRAGAIGRIQGPGQVLASGPAGAFDLALDLGALATPDGFAVLRAGESWSFQAWHRDSTQVGATTNLTDGTTLRFR